MKDFYEDFQSRECLFHSKVIRQRKSFNSDVIKDTNAALKEEYRTKSDIYSCIVFRFSSGAMNIYKLRLV